MRLFHLFISFAVVPPPLFPASAFTADNGIIQLSWNAPAVPEECCSFYCVMLVGSDGKSTNINSTSTSTTLPNLEPNVTYMVNVACGNAEQVISAYSGPRSIKNGKL